MRRPAPGSTRGVLTLLLVALLALVAPLSGSSTATGSTRPTGGDRTAQVGRHADHDAVSGASTRLTSSRGRSAAPKAQLQVGAVVLATAPSTTDRLLGSPAPGIGGAAARSTPRNSTLSRAPPA